MKKQHLLYSCGAFGTVLLTQAASLSSRASGCTGVCGSCGGSCIGLLGTLLFLGVCAVHKKSAE